MTGRSAVVIGASIAGMCAAQVLAQRVDRVTIVERDGPLQDGLTRAGTPQGRHFHVLLARGAHELERRFPGFTDAMVAAGAHRIDLARDVAALRLEGWMPHDQASVQVLLASRGLTERVVRERLARHANVRMCGDAEVSALMIEASRRPRVSGVHLGAGNGDRTLKADLVVDASGRRSHAPQWLAALGVAPPAETVVDGHVGYSSRWFHAPEPGRWPSAWWWKAALVQEDEHITALLFPVEPQRWVVTLVGIAGRHPPTDEAGFMAAVAGLRSPIIDRMLRLATPLTKVYGYRDLANRLRHHERGDPLDGFVAVGDAVCALNPVYGQGMSTATLCAAQLAAVLDRGDIREPGLARRFLRAQARLLRGPWQMAVGADFRFAASEGRRPPGIGLINRYMDGLVRAAMANHALRVQVDEVLNMLRPPAALFTPGVAVRVAAASLRRLFVQAQPVPTMPPGVS